MQTIQIPIWRFGEITTCATIDAEDLPKVSGIKWYLSKKGYGDMCHRQQQRLGLPYRYMHQLIMPPGPGFQTAHYDHNKLNNVKENLRVLTQSDNLHTPHDPLRRTNRSGYRGVSFAKDIGKWQAKLIYNTKTTFIGLFETAYEAALAYNDCRISFGLEPIAITPT